MAQVSTRLEQLRERLATNLAIQQCIEAGEAPTEADLAGAPILRDWRRAVHLITGTLALEGMVTGHPQFDGQWVTTSPLVALDPEGRWARTLSRWYRLEEPASEDGK